MVGLEPHLPYTFCQCPFSLQLARPSGTCTLAAPPHPQCRVCLGGCSEVCPGGPVLVPPVGSALEPPLVACAYHELEPMYKCVIIKKWRGWTCIVYAVLIHRLMLVTDIVVWRKSAHFWLYSLLEWAPTRSELLVEFQNNSLKCYAYLIRNFV